MDILLLLIPLSLVLVGGIAWVMLWAAKSGQFDDLEGPGHSVIMDDDTPHPSGGDMHPADKK
ncbi:MAG: cytochrome oxidase maturation protein, cbb3-type [Hydrogenophilales bacterium 16-64-46]|nr:MAG: cytochrome oxidase maturation protein, cbb3-type [Hydrogenophilales bacterium 12-64-13]OYZ05126.1 MAG: cytochrome oxidase maturation protein, cbb3-type [Hydrogenophilales bacterium 16-64-46]OZA37944.1 MAG: cytochrome oxidase maturation protein, cbb3-type [Hydrogenophilales bacterium 17-64-34]HQT00526.1 cbb3-type cytochrome oxidase assembly protein CcoS [Thiobacillus sp.]